MHKVDLQGFKLKSSSLPPKMKSVQWAARTARASGSGTQAPRSEAVKLDEV